MPPATDDSNLSFALPGRRCDKHAFMRTADGTCIRCSREALRAGERRRAAWTALVCAGAIAALGLVIARRASASAQAATTLTAASGTSAAFDIADDGTRRSAKLEENERVAAVIDEANPPPTPVIVTTSLRGITPERRDRAFAILEDQRQHVLRENAAAAKSLTDRRLAEENQILADIHRREAADAPARAVFGIAPLTRAPVLPLRVTGRRHCGGKVKDPQYEFNL